MKTISVFANTGLHNAIIKNTGLYGYHLNYMVDSYFQIQQYIPYRICPVVVVCADR